MVLDVPFVLFDEIERYRVVAVAERVRNGKKELLVQHQNNMQRQSEWMTEEYVMAHSPQ